MADTVKISELVELASGSIIDGTILPVVSGGTTQKVQMSSVKAYVNSGVVTDSELSAQVSSINSTISSLTTDNINEGSDLYYTDARVKTKLNAESVLSGSTLSVVGGGSVDNVNTITFTGATVGGSSGSAIVTIAAATSLTVGDGVTTANDVDTITFSGATVTDSGGGNIVVTNALNLTIEEDGGDTANDVTNITFFGASLNDRGGGFVEITVAEGGDSVAIMTHTSSLNQFTSSINSELDTELYSKTILSSSAQISSDISGSFIEVSSSVESRITTLEAGGASIPVGTISGSAQITEFGFISSSINIIGGDSILVSSASGDGTLDITIGVLAGPGGGGSGDVTYPVGYHIISQSTSTYESNIILSGVYVDENQNVTFSAFSSSVDSRFGSGGGSDYISNVSFANNTLTFTGTGFGFNGPVVLSNGIISSSTQLDTLGYVSTDDLTSGFIATVLPQGTLSGSTQVSELGFISYENTPVVVSGSGQIILADAITSSFTTDFVTDTENRPYYSDDRVKIKLDVEGVFSSSAQINFESPLISSSAQVNYADVYNKLELWSGSNAVLITSGTAVPGQPYIAIDINSNAFAPYSTVATLLEVSGAFNSATILSGSSLDAAEQLASLGTVTTLYLNQSLNALNGFTGSLGTFGTTSASLASRIDTIGSVGFEIESGFQLISQSNSVSNLILDLVRIDSSGTTFNNFSASVAAGVGVGASTFAGLTDTEFSSYVGGDLVKYNATTEKWENTLQLNGAYVITGSLFVTGGAVTADSFVAGDVGTPIIDSATSLDISAATEVYISSTGDGVVIEDILVLNKVIGDAPTAPLTGSLMNSGSVDDNTKLWFFNGTEWKEVAFV